MDEDNNLYKVLFIVSNKTELENSIKYSIQKSKAIINFKNIVKIRDRIKEGFTTYVYYFEIISKKILFLILIKIILFIIFNSMQKHIKILSYIRLNTYIFLKSNN